MHHCMAGGLLLSSLLVLWVLGLVPSFSLVISILALLGFAIAISYIQTPVVSKLVYWFYGGLIVFIMINATYSLIPASIKEELGGIRRSETIKTAEWLHQAGGETFQVIREQCKKDFDGGFKDVMDKLHQSTSHDKTQEMIQDVEKLEEQRQKCSDAILKLGEKGLGSKTKGWFGDIGLIGWTAILVAVIALGRFGAYVTGKDLVCQITFYGCVIVVLYLMGSWIISPAFGTWFTNMANHELPSWELWRGIIRILIVVLVIPVLGFRFYQGGLRGFIRAIVFITICVVVPWFLVERLLSPHTNPSTAQICIDLKGKVGLIDTLCHQNDGQKNPITPYINQVSPLGQKDTVIKEDLGKRRHTDKKR